MPRLKRGAEALSHSYAALFGLPTTCLRFFTVYGPWGRPDMAALKFADAIAHGRPIEVYGHGQMSRDFTYVADVVEAVSRLLERAGGGARARPRHAMPAAPWRVVNIAGGAPVPLDAFIAAFEAALGTPARRTLLPMQPGDVSATAADVSLLRALGLAGCKLATPIADGVAAVVDWYRRDRARLQDVIAPAVLRIVVEHALGLLDRQQRAGGWTSTAASRRPETPRP